MRRRILVVNDSCDCGCSYSVPFRALGECTSDDSGLLLGERDVDLVVFTGGSDVDPALYGEVRHRSTHVDVRRDAYEVELFKRALELGIPMVGVCRGAQFLCVMAGGKLVQDVGGHQVDHEVRTSDGRWLEVSSLHHQMMLPPVGAEVLAWAYPRCSDFYEGGGGVCVPEREFEVVRFPGIGVLGLQFHPEVMGSSSGGFRYCQELVASLLGI
jgi:putative glutamine amidotransferase